MSLKDENILVKVWLSPERQGALEKLHLLRELGKSEVVELSLDLLFSRPPEEIVAMVYQRREGR